MSSPFAMPANMDTVQSTLDQDYDVVVATTSILVALSTIAIALRVYVRTCMTKTFGKDDATMVAAWVCFMVTAGLSYVSTGVERELVDHGRLTVSTNVLVQIIRYCNAAYSLTMLFVKISLGLFFLKLFATSAGHKWQRIVIWAFMGVSTALGVVYLILTVATCGIMVQSQKTTSMHTGSDWCPTQQAFVNVSIAWSFLNTASDITFTLLGVLALCKTKLSTIAKVSAASLLVLGSIGIVASCARIAVQLPLTDIRVSGILLVEWSNIEAGICITAGSLITLRPMFMQGVASARATLASLSKSSYSTNNSHASSQTCTKCTKCTKQSTQDSDRMEKGESKVLVTTTYSVHSGDNDSLDAGHKSPDL